MCLIPILVPTDILPSVKKQKMRERDHVLFLSFLFFFSLSSISEDSLLNAIHSRRAERRRRRCSREEKLLQLYSASTAAATDDDDDDDVNFLFHLVQDKKKTLTFFISFLDSRA